METTSTTIRIDKTVKKKSSELLDGLGMTISDAVNIFLRQIILCNGLPFEIKYPEPTPLLLEAIEESEKLMNDPTAKRYRNIHQLFTDIRNE